MNKINLLLLCLCLGGCMATAPDDEKEWLNNLIEQFKNEPVGNPPQAIWRYNYNSEIVYYVPPQCCDQYSILYDENGNIICAPDGGKTGDGDGMCPDFFDKRESGTLVWQDERKR